MKTGRKRFSGEKAQVAALPWRRVAGIEILLVTSRESRRWVIPKGWPMKGLLACAAAAREALEEAGVVGRIGKTPIGAYHYEKRMKNGAVLVCRVDVFPLEVVAERKSWREKAERTRRWFPLEEAADLVEESELSEIVRNFAVRARGRREIISPYEPAG